MLKKKNGGLLCPQRHKYIKQNITLQKAKEAGPENLAQPNQDPWHNTVNNTKEQSQKLEILACKTEIDLLYAKMKWILL
jgi:peroxiredoxin family protein